MEQMGRNQPEREWERRFIEDVAALRLGQPGLPLREYYPPEVAEAIERLLDDAVLREREGCAITAESAGEAAGALGPGQTIGPDPSRSAVCLEVAERIRRRRKPAGVRRRTIRAR